MKESQRKKEPKIALMDTYTAEYDISVERVSEIFVSSGPPVTQFILTLFPIMQFFQYHTNVFSFSLY